MATKIRCETWCKYNNTPGGVCSLKKITLGFLPGQEASDVWCRNQKDKVVKKAKSKTELPAGCSDSRGCGCNRCRDLYGV